VFISKDADGGVTWAELSDLSSEEAAAFDDLDGEIADLVNEEDIVIVAAELQPNSSAGFLVYENVWATRLRDAIVNAEGRLVDNARISPAVVEAAMKAAQGGAS